MVERTARGCLVVGKLRRIDFFVFGWKKTLFETSVWAFIYTEPAKVRFYEQIDNTAIDRRRPCRISINLSKHHRFFAAANGMALSVFSAEQLPDRARVRVKIH